MIEVGYQAPGFVDESSLVANPVGNLLCLMELPQALLPSPGADGDVLGWDQAEGGQTLEGGIDPAVHGDVGRSNGVRIGFER